MPYFDRLRQLAAAGAPARHGPAWAPGLEVEEIRVAPPPVLRETVVAPRREPVVSSTTVATAPQETPTAVVRGDLTTAGDRAETPPAEAPPAATSATTETIRAEIAPGPETLQIVETDRVVTATAPEVAQVPPAPAERALSPAAATPETPATMPRGRAPRAGPAAAPDPAAPAERLHRALAEVQQWMEQPAAAGEPGDRREPITAPARPVAPPALAAAITEARTELSIGTIEVTVEEPPAPAPPRVRPAAPAPRAPAREIVPRDYLRGW